MNYNTYNNPYVTPSYSPFNAPNTFQGQMFQPTNQNPYINAQNNQSQVAQTDFNGNFVTSFEQVRNANYTDKTMVYLDTANDKIYIKRINEKGTPVTESFGLVAIEESNTKSVTKVEAKESSNEIIELKNKVEKMEEEIIKMKQFQNKKINDKNGGENGTTK